MCAFLSFGTFVYEQQRQWAIFGLWRPRTIGLRKHGLLKVILNRVRLSEVRDSSQEGSNFYYYFYKYSSPNLKFQVGWGSICGSSQKLPLIILSAKAWNFFLESRVTWILWNRQHTHVRHVSIHIRMFFGY